MRGDSGPETSVEDQQKLLEAAQLRVDDQARSLLDDRQFGVFRTVNQDFTQNRVRRAAQPRWNRTAPFYRWLVDFYFLIILPLGCARSCGGLIREELQNDTLGFLTTRPVKRAVLVILKYLCQTAWLQIIALLEALLLFGAGRLREVPGLGALLPLFLAVQFLAVPAWSALGLMLGQITRRYLALALVYGLVVELGIGSIPTNINSLSLMRHLETLLSRNAALESIFQWTPDGALFAAGMLVLAAGVFLSAAALLFTFLEYHAGTEMHK
jgi:hypothetical protein